MLKSNPYKKLSKYYDIYKGYFDDDIPLYLSICKKKDKILEIGCGSGRVLKAFLKAGYTITGVDISKDMLNIAKEKLSNYLSNGKLKLINHDFRLSPLDIQYNYVMITFYTFNYLLEYKEQVNFLENIYKSMSNGSAIIIDLFYPRPLSHRFLANDWEERSFESNGRKICLKQKEMINKNIVKRIQLFSENKHQEKVVSYRRYVKKEDINSLLNFCGFENIMFTDGYDLNKFHRLNTEEPTYNNFVVKATKP